MARASPPEASPCLSPEKWAVGALRFPTQGGIPSFTPPHPSWLLTLPLPPPPPFPACFYSPHNLPFISPLRPGELERGAGSSFFSLWRVRRAQGLVCAHPPAVATAPALFGKVTRVH